ncbi:uncharacterized protein HD556DRAFT_1361879 [Suillus plorans]|uniref:Uncharacterized protein n=1 Tax=Suillus plorans TaxID=116603 RepID=A0A9P7DJP5_9AGAM|nr:uncharacterized protein HD556DRAFT_1361879 [Suillus plorans]KAG1795968.1 hypothetical protein HD556DRAFT_1361879 [Suillus plorans]
MHVLGLTALYCLSSSAAMKFISLTTMIISVAVLAKIVTASDHTGGCFQNSIGAERSQIITITFRSCIFLACHVYNIIMIQHSCLRN